MGSVPCASSLLGLECDYGPGCCICSFGTVPTLDAELVPVIVICEHTRHNTHDLGNLLEQVESVSWLPPARPTCSPSWQFF